MKHLTVLGSTGSIGTQTLDVIRMHPDRLCVEALGCGRNISVLEHQIREFHPAYAAVWDEKDARELAVRTADLPVKILSGMDGMVRICTLPETDTVVTAIVGMIGLKPTVEAIKAGKHIALANKETCVTAGHIIMPLSKDHHVQILPVDSEHSAIFQALQGRAGSAVRRILLTASGGPFRGFSREKLDRVTVKEALAHPTWTMGPKITVDSATMVNKGLEVIEARWLFDVEPEKIEVVIQPESTIHSMVEYEDGSILAQMGCSDMRIPIQYALTYPEHIPSPAEPLDFTKLRMLHFDVPDDEVFEGLPLARRALCEGGSMPCVFNAANEWANERFRTGSLSFTGIYRIIRDVMEHHTVIPDPDVDEIMAIQTDTNRYCEANYG